MRLLKTEWRVSGFWSLARDIELACDITGVNGSDIPMSYDEVKRCPCGKQRRHDTPRHQ